MKREIAFKITIDGVEKAISNENELAEAVKLVREEYKKSDYGTKERAKAAKQLGALKKLQADSRQEVRDLAREFEIAADKGKGSYRAINAELVNTRRQYKELSKEERGLFGPELISRISKLDKELKEIDKDLGQYQRNVGNYESALDGVAGALSDLGGIDITALATPGGAIAAVGAAAIATTAYVKEMTGEVRKLRGELQTLTGFQGAQLDEFTARVGAVADTFDTSSNEITQSANALSKQLGISFEEAVGFIERGFVQGLDINGEFIDTLREYPTFFADAFGPGEDAANAFFKVIKLGNEQGIFNDKAVDVIKEATIRLRELPTATKEALTAIGLDSKAIADQIEKEGIGSAIETVTQQLGTLRADSPEVGEAIAGIFGGPGEDAGLGFLLSLQDINSAVDDGIDLSNEYQVQQQRTLEVNQEYARAQVEVANAFGDTGASIDNLLVQGQTLLLRFLVPLIDYVKEVFGIFDPLIGSLLRLGRAFGVLGPEVDAVGLFTKALSRATKAVLGPLRTLFKVVGAVGNAYAFVVEKGRALLENLGLLKKATADQGETSGRAGRQTKGMGVAAKAAAEAAKELAKQEKEAAEAAKKLAEENKKAGVATEKFAKGSIGFLRQQLTGLKKDLVGATGDQEKGILENIIDVEGAIKEIEDGRELIKRALARTGKELAAVPDIDTARDALSNIAPNPDLVIGRVERSTKAIKAGVVAQGKAYDKLVKDRIAGAEEAANRELEIERRKAALIQEVSSGVFNTFNSINSALQSDVESRANEEVSLLQERYQGEIEAAEGNTERQEELRAELEEAEAAIRAESFEEQKKYRIASALSSLAEGTVNILSRPSVIPDPFGAIFKGVQVAALAATTSLQIGEIKRQRVAARGTVVDGWIRGDSHRSPSGGVSLMLNGQPVLAEGGEYTGTDEMGGKAVINKRSAAIFRDLLTDTHGMQFAGKREMYSAVNSYRGNGVKFMEAGGVINPSLDSLAMFKSGSSRGEGEIYLSPSSVRAIATATERAVYQGSREGTEEGSSSANRRREREQKLRNRTG